MRISNFDGAKDKIPKQLEMTWESFAASLGPHEYRPGGATDAEDQAAKEACPCFSPAEYPDGGPTNVAPDDYPEWARRGKRNVTRVWMLVLDVDKVDQHTPATEETLNWFVSRVHELGLTALFYSSWSHARKPWRFRVVIPLDRPVPAEEWPGFWARAITIFRGICDDKCKDASRIYFGAFAPLGTEASHFYHVVPGAHLSTEAVFALELPEGTHVRETPGQERRTKDSEAVALLAAAWPQQRRHEAHLALAGGLLSSGFSDERAVEFLCAVARGADPDNELREKRENAVAHTREQLDANENITGWTTLASIVGYDVVEKVRQLVERAPPITEDQLQRYAKQLKRSKDDKKVELGAALEKVVEKRVFPEPLALLLAAELGARFTEYDPKSIAEHFDGSLSLMRADGEDVTVEQVAARVKSKQEEVREQKKEQRKRSEQQRQAVDFDKASRIREAYKNGRSHPYTAEELRGWQHVIGTGHRWVLQKDRTYYFFFNGSYSRPYSEAEAHGGALRELSPASSAGVDIYKQTKDGTDFKSLRQIVAEYGTVAEQVATDLRAQFVTYDEQERTIIEAPCPLRRLEPRYDADVDRWMYEVAGPMFYEDFKIWFAILPDLNFIRSALALIGVHSIGKSMSALGGSGLWTTRGPCRLEDALAPFNDAILKCPLVFADEHLPKDFHGVSQTERLRGFIQETERSLRRKHMPSSKCVGVTPLIIAAHDLEVLRPAEAMSNNEVDGSVERFLIIPARIEGAQFLANMRPTSFERGWVENDIIARHIWWLYYNQPRQSKGRFFFKPDTADYAMWFSTSGGSKSSVLRWLVSYLANRAKFENDANTLMHVRIYQGHVLVNIQGLLSFWDKYVGNEKCPPSGLMSRIIAEMSYTERVKLPDGSGKMVNYRVLQSKYLYTWAKNTDLITEEEITAQLAIDSKLTSVGLTLERR